MSIVFEPRERIRVRMLGAGFIGQMHSLALRLARHARAERVEPLLERLADRDLVLAGEVADRYGWATARDDWQALLDDRAFDLFVNAGPNALHHEPTVAAAEAGVAVFCEKPLASTADEALALWRAVAATGVEHRCAFMHRFIPALQHARALIRAGELGTIRHVRSRFFLDMAPGDGEPSWRFDVARAGRGAIGDLGSHHIDVARFLVGEVRAVTALTSTWTESERFAVNEDAFACLAELEGGATAIFEADRVAAPHALSGTIEVDGTEGSLAFAMERLNELVLRRPGTGEATRLVTGPGDPYVDTWLPAGIQGSHPIGWQECFAHQMLDVLALAAGLREDSLAATFEDGYRVAEIVDAIVTSAAERQLQEVRFRSRATMDPTAGD